MQLRACSFNRVACLLPLHRHRRHGQFSRRNQHDITQQSQVQAMQAPSLQQAQASGQQDQASAGQHDDVSSRMTDAHCHPQLDPAHMHAVLQLRSSKLAAMSVAYDVDWDIMLQLHQAAGSKVIPGFGIHPWWAHLHASSQGSTWQQLLEAPSQQQLQAALDILTHTDSVTNSGAYATNRPSAPQADKAGTTAATSNSNSRNESRDSSSGGSPGNGTFTGIQVGSAKPEQQQGQQQQQQASKQSRLCLGEGLRVVPQQEWMGRLRQLLEDMPGAIVGEVGIDRSATIPGSRARTSLQHQMELLKLQVALAAEFQRPISVHCVKGYGHLLDFFASLAAATAAAAAATDKDPAAAAAGVSVCPPKIMLHSYGGSVEDIPRFCRVPNGIGPRFYFSFSHAINNRTPDKLRARIAAVPDDRLLLESDQVTPLVIDDSLVAICEVIADVKGWTMQEAADRLYDNFKSFYQQQL